MRQNNLAAGDLSLAFLRIRRTEGKKQELKSKEGTRGEGDGPDGGKWESAELMWKV